MSDAAMILSHFQPTPAAASVELIGASATHIAPQKELEKLCIAYKKGGMGEVLIGARGHCELFLSDSL
jgi:hypothetical protein